MATSTVEDYLKQIYQAQLTSPGALVPTGQVASALTGAPCHGIQEAPLGHSLRMFHDRRGANVNLVYHGEADGRRGSCDR